MAPPRMFVVAGPPGAGKSQVPTWFQQAMGWDDKAIPSLRKSIYERAHGRAR